MKPLTDADIEAERMDKTIAPTDLRDFLESLGWRYIERALRDRRYVFENVSFPQRQLMFPMDIAAPDYQEATCRVVQKLSEMTGQSNGSILSRMGTFRDDVLRLRVLVEGNDRELPLSFASLLISSTEKLLRAAAYTALRPQMHHSRLVLSEAAQFVEHARFDPTEAGSLVLRVACPINAMEVQSGLPLEASDTPFVRQVMLSLQRALSGLATAIEADRLDDLVHVLKYSQAPLISSNLCEAICAMYDDRIGNSLDIGFDWSVLHKVDDPMLTRPIRIQHGDFLRVEELRRELRVVERD
ncbi:hypothetical protein [Trinickia dinghuensis]|uniref:Uncharacterized protein n=1 Tax=Trinickia dinghuensis TaxID=2291023 RepID=A0A3D8JSI4_9BURK|nr:hypothetical protein [Trinickia dinghuensis]RDU95636.1 hypothetical protein DWV00_27305 [Trinickia dinghuensis]